MNEIEQYLIAAAKARGMDPQKILEVVNTEGGVNDPFQQSRVVKNGVRERSYGPLQLYIDGGVGSEAIKAGIDPRKDWKGGIDFGLDTAARDGSWKQWYGPQNKGLPLDYGLSGAKPMGLTLNSRASGPVSPGSIMPAITGGRTVGDMPVASADTPAAAPNSILDTIKSEGLFAGLKAAAGNEQVTGGIGALGKAFGGGNEGAKRLAEEHATPMPSNIAAFEAMDSSRMANAQQLMSQLLSKRRGGIPGKSIMG